VLLALCAGLDGKVKIWDALGSYKCMRTYLGHSKGVKDINFTNDGAKFVSVGYDKNIRLWDTETGQVGERVSISGVKFSDAAVAYSFDNHSWSQSEWCRALAC
jgi:WD40 repeat protein